MSRTALVGALLNVAFVVEPPFAVAADKAEITKAAGPPWSRDSLAADRTRVH